MKGGMNGRLIKWDIVSRPEGDAIVPGYISERLVIVDSGFGGASQGHARLTPFRHFRLTGHEDQPEQKKPRDETKNELKITQKLHNPTKGGPSS